MAAGKARPTEARKGLEGIVGRDRRRPAIAQGLAEDPAAHSCASEPEKRADGRRNVDDPGGAGEACVAPEQASGEEKHIRHLGGMQAAMQSGARREVGVVGATGAADAIRRASMPQGEHEVWPSRMAEAEIRDRGPPHRRGFGERGTEPGLVREPGYEFVSRACPLAQAIDERRGTRHDEHVPGGGASLGDPPPCRPHLGADVHALPADDVAMVGGDDELHAIGRAVAFAPPDTEAVRTAEMDWIAGDTLIATFETVTVPGDTAKRTRMRGVVATGSARAFQQVAAKDADPATPNLSYNRGRRITVRFTDGQVRQVDVEDQASGLYLEAAVRADTTRAGAPRPPSRVP